MDLYHVLNRGVDKRIIFEDSQDHARFVHDMYEFNSTERSENTHRNMFDVGRRTLDFSSQNPEKIVDIHGWCLMGNHYHMILSERVPHGISLFLKKLNGGYAKYFNERYDRAGALFQGKTKKILIETDAHFLHILNYVHFNPLDFHDGSQGWRNGKITSSSEALDFLAQYKWSSYQDYIGIRNFPSTLSKTLFTEVFNNKYKEFVERYLRDVASYDTTYLFIE